MRHPVSRRLRRVGTVSLLLASSAAWMVGLPSTAAQAYTVPASAAVAIQQAVQAHSTAPMWVPTWVPSVVGKTADQATPVITWKAHSYSVGFVVTPTTESALVQPATAHGTAFQGRFGANAVESVSYSVTQYGSRAKATSGLWHFRRAGVEPPSQFGASQEVHLSLTWIAHWHPQLGGALTWREGDWTIEESAIPKLTTDITVARQIATTLEHYRLPATTGVIAVVGTASADQFTVRWQEGRSVLSTGGQDCHGEIAFPKQATELVAPNIDSFKPWAHFVASLVHP